MSTPENGPQNEEDLRESFERDILEAMNRTREEAYRLGYYNGFVAAFPCGYREAVRDKSVPITRAGWDQVPDEVTETGRTYCHIVMTTLHMGKEPGWSLLPLEKFWEKAERPESMTEQAPDSR